MTKDVLISISGLQFAGGENSEPVEVSTSGSYYKKNGRHYSLYDEVAEDTAGTTKNIIKDIIHIATLKMIFPVATCPKIRTAITLIKMSVSCRTGSSFLKCCKTILVIELFLLCITKYIICFGYFLKILLCLFIPRIYVRMIFFGKLTVCFFDLLLIRSFPDTKDIVIISFLHDPHLRIK